MRSRALRRATLAIASWPDGWTAHRVYCQACALERPSAALIAEAGWSIIAGMRFEALGAGAVAAFGHG
jgi:hypothetical protein